MPTIQCSTTNVSLIPGTAFIISRSKIFKVFSFPRYGFDLSHGFRSRPSSVLHKFPQNQRTLFSHRRHVVSATGTDAVEAPSDVVEEVVSAETTEESTVSSDASSPTQAKAMRTKGARKSEMPPVKDEDLVPGATFTGKVVSIQPFGAFVDFGAFTDGLVHISRLSEGFVKDVGSVVSVGQEVKVKLLEVNTETQRISLSMNDMDDGNKQNPKPQVRSALAREEKGQTERKNRRKDDGSKKTTKFEVGQELQGIVKNKTESGAFISLPDGEEGFLPSSEADDQGFSEVMGASSALDIGQEVTVSVLRITKGRATLTMKAEEDDLLDSTIPDTVLSLGTNPFVLAFRKDKSIASFLDEREKLKNKVKESEISGAPVIDKATENLADGVSSSVVDTYEKDFSKNIDVRGDASLKEIDSSTVAMSPQLEVSTTNLANEQLPSTIETGTISSASLKDEVGGIVSEITISETTEEEELKNTADINIPSAFLVDANLGAAAEEDSTNSLNLQVNVASMVGSATEDASKTSTQMVSHQTDVSLIPDVKLEDDVPMQSLTKSEVSLASPVEDEIAKPLSVEDDSKSYSSVESVAASSPQGLNEAAVSAALVKQLRDETGAGMMDCKKALSATGGDIVKAQEFLRKKGLASAEKKASRATAEGRIGSYIHDSRIGVLVEVNCETDFVSRGDIFKGLVDDLAMQVAACPQVEYLSTEDVSAELVDKEREIEMQKEDLLSKPEQIRSKIVEGRIRKRLEEVALLEQPYIKNDSVLVKDLVKQTIATIGENIKVARFVRFNLGEGLEKKSQDFAAEVAAQTAAKPVPPSQKEQPVSEETKDTIEKLKISVSPAMVKQLREETGAGMMDCKRALAETEGNLQKAQEYLRKKGLSSADKKSSRLATEGRIGSYIHDARIGVLIEVNCETDFVGRSEQFKELVDDLAMQVAACPQVRFVSIDEIPESIVNKEQEIEMQKEDLLSKPENIREKIVEGRISKRLGELALLEQPFIKDDSVLVKDLIKQTVAALGENIKVRRFVRFTLGEEVGNETSMSE